MCSWTSLTSSVSCRPSWRTSGSVAALRVSLPETRLLTVEDFLILQGNERLLPQSGRRISYCVEAFLALRNRPVLASTCLTKPEWPATTCTRWKRQWGRGRRRLLADNPSSRRRPRRRPRQRRPAFQESGKDVACSPPPILGRIQRPVGGVAEPALCGRPPAEGCAGCLGAAVGAAACELRARLDKSSERFWRNVGSMCGQARDAALGYQCELIAFDRRLRALEQCTTTSIAPALQGRVGRASGGTSSRIR